MMEATHYIVLSQIVIGIMTVLLSSGFLMFILKLAFARLEKVEERKMIDPATCEEKHRRIDEHLIEEKDERKKLVEATIEIKNILIKIDGNIGQLDTRIKTIEEESKKRREENHNE